ncbi:TIGR02611 family protein [Thermopolyspora sp. NPDC052614]|uniref:TIGR02611 family protein n=1 Tax=Thermopolyspora sp. NPDC052614 TaxID=3155682 RepID=UPI003435ABE5
MDDRAQGAAVRGERAEVDGDAEPRTALGRWLDGVRANPAGRLTLKIVVGVLGAAMVIGGLILVPFPGPGWLIVFGGLAVLATEFAWAHHVLEFGKKVLGIWTQWLLRQNWPVRILVSVVTLAIAGAIVWFMVRLTLGVDLIVEGRQIVGL